jgi:hypothetical protein
MEPPKTEENPILEKEVTHWEDGFNLSSGSCCDEGDFPVEPVECFLK